MVQPKVGLKLKRLIFIYSKMAAIERVFSSTKELVTPAQFLTTNSFDNYELLRNE